MRLVTAFTLVFAAVLFAGLARDGRLAADDPKGKADKHDHPPATCPRT